MKNIYRNTTAQGRELEEYVSGQLLTHAIDFNAKRERGSGRGTHDKGDIHTELVLMGQQAGIECKHEARLNLKEGWKQAKRLERLGCEPILIMKQLDESFEDTRAVIYLDTLLELIKRAGCAAGKAQFASQTPQVDRDIVFTARRALEANKALEKALKEGYEL